MGQAFTGSVHARRKRRPTTKLCTKSPQSHPRQWVDQFQMLSKRNLKGGFGIPPTVVGGLFKSSQSMDLKYPPTAVGGITVGFQEPSVESI